MPYEERLKLLKWSTLEQRRLFSSLIECYKTINRLNGLNPSAFFTFANEGNNCFSIISELNNRE